MKNLEKLIYAVKNKKQIEFEYNKPGKVLGKRIGDTYAVFIFTSKDDKQSTKVHLVQTSGVSDTSDKNPLPNFRMFNIEDLTNVEVLNSDYTKIHPSYNPDWDGYSSVIEKI